MSQNPFTTPTRRARPMFDTPDERADDRAARTERTLRALVEASPLAIITLDMCGRVGIWSDAAQRLFGWPAEEAVGAPLAILPDDAAEDHPVRCATGDPLRTLTDVEAVCRRKDGTQIDVTVSAAPLRDSDGELDGTMLVIADQTERRHLQEQYRLSQRMESIGLLAGGIAHDFNNLLSVIRGASEMLLEAAPQQAPERLDLLQIVDAAERAATLTQQLLAFGRRQVLRPKVLDLSAVVAGVEPMLRRLIGADIELVTTSEPTLGRVRADPGQFEQVIMNLVVNARDAMPRGGRLVLHTENVLLDEEYVERHAVVQPGRYVRLTVTDTGIGMDRETQSRVFEPFFTSKAPGQGTGLGLSTVYGIVKQSGGFIWIYSEPGLGTTFKIYLPRVDEAIDRAPVDATETVAVEGTECVLLVEDEDMLRSLARRVLERQGYTVLDARNGVEALRVCAECDACIDVVVTDVIMPEMGGRELGERVASLHPETRVLYMSGYAGVDVVRRGLLGPDAAFIQKPFSPRMLARKIREILDT